MVTPSTSWTETISFLITYSSAFCEKLTIHKDSSLKSNLSLHLLKCTPELREQEIIFESQLSINENHDYFAFHLLPSSEIRLSTCYMDLISTLYLVEGTSNFNKGKDAHWGDNFLTKYYLYKGLVGLSCPTYETNEFLIDKEDVYYIIYANQLNSSQVSVTFNISLQVQRH